MLPDLPSESSRLFVEKPFLECPELNSRSWTAIFSIPVRVRLACLFQMSSVGLAKAHASPDCPFLPHGNVKPKPPFQGIIPSLKRLDWFLPSWHAGPTLVRRKDARGCWREKGIPCLRPTSDGENFSFLSNSEMLTGITSQDSKCFLSCYNPLKFFFSHSPSDSVSVSHSFSAGLGAPPPPCKPHPGQGKRPRRLSSLWSIIGACWEVFVRDAELISYLNTKDSRARVCR